MNPQQIELVQQSFAKVRPIAAAAAELFYARLFELDPALKSLFKGDMRQQGTMLMSMISGAVSGLSKPDALIPVLMNLGRRHVGYGVVDAHYNTVGTALIDTLAKGLGADFTAEVREAWCAAYQLLSDVMQRGAKEFKYAA